MKREPSVSRRPAERDPSAIRLASQHAILRVLAHAPSLREATPRLLQAICESLAWDFGAVWRPDRGRARLRCVETWRGASAALAGFDRTCRACEMPPGVG